MLVSRRYINEIFTSIVNTFISEGYTFSPSMSGHQGEEMKVDLDNGKQTVRVRLERESWHDYDAHFYADGLEIFVETFDKVCTDSFDTLWNGKGAEIYRQLFYEVKRGRMYTDDKQFILDRQAIRKTRFQRKERKTPLYGYLDSSKARRIAWNFIRKQPGCKTKKPEDIISVNRLHNSTGNYYSVIVNSGKATKTFYMSLKASV